MEGINRLGEIVKSLHTSNSKLSSATFFVRLQLTRVTRNLNIRFLFTNENSNPHQYVMAEGLHYPLLIPIKYFFSFPGGCRHSEIIALPIFGITS